MVLGQVLAIVPRHPACLPETHRFSRSKPLELSIDPLLTGHRPFSRMTPASTFTGMTPVLKHIAAYICLVVGAAGLALPILPGVPALLLGFRLLGPDHRLTRGAVILWRHFRASIFGGA